MVSKEVELGGPLLKGEEAEVSPEDFVVYFGMFVVKVEPSALCSLSELQGDFLVAGCGAGRCCSWSELP